MRWSVTISAALHLGAVAWFGTRELALPRTEPTSETIAIELVEPPPPAPATTGEAHAQISEQTAAPARRGSIARGTRAESNHEPVTIDPEPTIAPEPQPTPRSKYFDVRRGERPDLTLPRADREEAPAGTTPQPGVTPSGVLAPDRTGKQSDQSPFVAKISSDGGVTFRDKPDVDIELAMPTPKIIGKGIADWYLSDKGPDGKRGRRTLEQYVGGSIDAGDAAGIDKGDRSGTIIIPLFRGNLSPIDWITRKTVGDPYASRKRDFLDNTREERAEMRARHRTELLAQTQVLVHDNCERAWASSTDARKRKQALFDLWDEIVDGTGDDVELAEAARAARAYVIGFIRARFPNGSRDAYTPDEINALGARQHTSATFSPYE